MEFYNQYSYFTPEDIRDGCHPRIMEHSNAQKAIVLVHGLTDSPYYMTAIGQFFYEKLGYNVYIPLLHCHGLKEPEGMESVKLSEWKANVDYAVKSAAARCSQVSIGGLSTGGALSFYMAAENSEINGTLYLFSAALDLSVKGSDLLGDKGSDLLGDIVERILRSGLAQLFDSKKDLIGENPYKYDHMDMDGAEELAQLIKETDDLTKKYNRKNPFPRRIFAAHSECDGTASITGIEDLEKVTISERFKFFRIGKEYKVAHASLVLKHPIFSNGKEIVKENPQFDPMMEEIAAFEKN